MRRLGLVVLLALAFLAPAPAALAAPSGPATATVITVPPLAGFSFAYGGRVYTTGADGSVHVPRSRSYTPPPVARTRQWPLPGGGFAEFDRWYGLDNLIHGTRPARAAVSTFRPVRFRFTKLTGEPVERSALGKITFKSSTGFLTELPAGTDTFAMQATRTVPDTDGLAVKEMYFTVQDVDVEGNNVVNRSQTKFLPNRTRAVDVPLLFFDASVRARDALFHFGVEGKLVLQYPSARTRTFQLDDNGVVALPGLPRGQYHLSVVGPGLKLVQPVAMSKPQAVDLKVFTWLDLAVVLLGGLTVAVLLVLVGHRQMLRRHRAVPELAEEELEDLVPARKELVLAAKGGPAEPELFDWRAQGHLPEAPVEDLAESDDGEGAPGLDDEPAASEDAAPAELPDGPAGPDAGRRGADDAGDAAAEEAVETPAETGTAEVAADDAVAAGRDGPAEEAAHGPEDVVTPEEAKTSDDGDAVVASDAQDEPEGDGAAPDEGDAVAAEDSSDADEPPAPDGADAEAVAPGETDVVVAEGGAAPAEASAGQGGEPSDASGASDASDDGASDTQDDEPPDDPQDAGPPDEPGAPDAPPDGDSTSVLAGSVTGPTRLLLHLQPLRPALGRVLVRRDGSLAPSSARPSPRPNGAPRPSVTDVDLPEATRP